MCGLRMEENQGCKLSIKRKSLSGRNGRNTLSKTVKFLFEKCPSYNQNVEKKAKEPKVQ